MSKQFDVAVVGAGPAGYHAAIRAAQLGLKTVCIDRWVDASGQAVLGGTCLNVGCIPSKALLDSSHHYYVATKHFATHGIEATGLAVNFEQMIARKNEVVSQTSGGINYLMDKNKIDLFQGIASFENATHIIITKSDGSIEKAETVDIPFLNLTAPKKLDKVSNILDPRNTYKDVAEWEKKAKKLATKKPASSGLFCGQLAKRGKAQSVAALSACSNEPVQLQTPNGQLLGYVDENVEHYLGVP